MSAAVAHGPSAGRAKPPSRVAVCSLELLDDGWRLPAPTASQPVTAENYAAFKYGDTAAIPAFARALADAVVGALAGGPAGASVGAPAGGPAGSLAGGPAGGPAGSLAGAPAGASAVPNSAAPLFLTSSGYGFAPPAAAALLSPVAELLRARGLDVAEFSTARSSVTTADYATLGPAERARALRPSQLTPRLPAGTLDGAMVLTLDDVIVTGVHEAALDASLRRHRAANVLHAYLIDASAAAAQPSLEAALNGGADHHPAQLVALARARGFAPNSRFLKAVLRLPHADREAVLRGVPAPVSAWMAHAVAADRLERVPDLRVGALELLGRGTTAA